MKQTGEELAKALAAATDGLLYPSESDSPVTSFVRDGGALSVASPKDALKLGDYPAKTHVSTQGLERFFKPATEVQDWFGDEERGRAARFTALRDLLKANLTKLKVYRIGDVTKDVYVVGRSSAGEIAGIKTQVVET